MEPDAGSPRPPEQTTVVGYPGSTPAAAAPSGYASPGMASLRSQVSSVRLLVIACLALLLVLAVGVGVGLASSRAQLQDLSDQVAALSAQAAANAQQATDSGQAQGSGQTQGSGQAAPQESVQQLGAAVELPAGSDIPAGADTAGAILIGNPDAANVVEVYVDYQCPFCQRWEAEIGSVLAERALQPGSDLLLKQYNLAFLGETSPSLSPAGASARAASAAACVLDADGVETFVAFNQGVFASADPTEPPTQFSAEALSDLARQAGASDDAITCIESEAQVPFVAATTQAGFGRGVGGTPTVLVNGQTLGNPFTDPAITSLVAGS